MITVKKALSIINSSIKPKSQEQIDVTKSKNRILTSNVTSLIDSPPFDMSSMDGYAIKRKFTGKL